MTAADLRALIAERDGLAATLEYARRALLDAVDLVNDGSMATKEWSVFKRMCLAVSQINQTEIATHLARIKAEAREERASCIKWSRGIESYGRIDATADGVWVGSVYERKDPSSTYPRFYWENGRVNGYSDSPDTARAAVEDAVRAGR